MFILINRDQMELVAKHPNCMTLYSLGVINCPDCQETIPFDMDCLKDFLDSELEMLYISLTLEVPGEWDRSQLEYAIIYLINECKENILQQSEVCAQAEYAVEWDIEGYCSFVKGKKEPSMEEGLWENHLMELPLEKVEEIVRQRSEIIFKQHIQQPFRDY